jgi:hypothetical protein
LALKPSDPWVLPISRAEARESRCSKDFGRDPRIYVDALARGTSNVSFYGPNSPALDHPKRRKPLFFLGFVDFERHFTFRHPRGGDRFSEHGADPLGQLDLGRRDPPAILELVVFIPDGWNHRNRGCSLAPDVSAFTRVAVKVSKSGVDAAGS